MRLITRIGTFGRLIFLAIWIALLFGIATNIQAGWLYVVIAFLMILGLASAIISVRTLSGVKVEVALPELCERGAPNTATVTIDNPGRFNRYMIRVETSPGGDIEFDPPNLLATTVPARSRLRLDARFIPRRRGEARVESVTLSCGGPTGLYTKRRAARVVAAALVYPRVSESGGEALEAEAAQESAPLNRRLMVEDLYHYSLREYVPGDSLRRIHWKLTAKRNEPIMRINESRTYGLSAILIDNLRAHYPPGADDEFERLLERAVSLARHLLFIRGMSVTLYATAAPELSLETHELWEHALRWFAMIRLEDATPAGDHTAGRPPEYAEFLFGPAAGRAPLP
jgi:uncharacterized protein (DUF58 family)